MSLKRLAADDRRSATGNNTAIDNEKETRGG